MGLGWMTPGSSRLTCCLPPFYQFRSAGAWQVTLTSCSPQHVDRPGPRRHTGPGVGGGMGHRAEAHSTTHLSRAGPRAAAHGCLHRTVAHAHKMPLDPKDMKALMCRPHLTRVL